MESDVVVIGAGIYGTGTAWELAKRGKSVTVVERTRTQDGASVGIGKRGVRANGRDPRELPLMDIAYKLWPALEEELGSDIGYEQTGHLRLFENPHGGLAGGFPKAKAQKWLQNKNGIRTTLLNEEEVREKEPAINQDVIGALYCPNDGVVNHTATTRDLADAAKEEGAKFIFGEKVNRFDIENSTVEGVYTDEGRHITVNETVVVLANYGATELIESEFSITLPMWRALPQVLITESIDDPPVNHLIGHESRRLALKKVSGDKIMVSGGWRGKWDSNLEKGETILENVAGNYEDAVAVYPSLEDVNINEAHAATPESVSIDHLPIIDILPSTTNLLIGTGWSGHGFAISLAVNKLLADWIMTGSKPDELEPFTYKRFFS